MLRAQIKNDEMINSWNKQIINSQSRFGRSFGAAQEEEVKKKSEKQVRRWGGDISFMKVYSTNVSYFNLLARSFVVINFLQFSNVLLTIFFSLSLLAFERILKNFLVHFIALDSPHFSFDIIFHQMTERARKYIVILFYSHINERLHA